MVTWIQNPNHEARVTDGVNDFDVDVVNVTPPYMRTRAGGEWTDTLLALPHF